jgi:hypothetical protein
VNAAPQQRSLLDLGLRGRLVFAACFAGLVLSGVVWGQLAPDHVLGFQMFNESSRMRVELFREVERKGRRVLVPVPDGVWRAPDRRGKPHAYAWQERIRYYPLRELGREVPAKYGLSAQLFRLQAALDDMAAHIPEDVRTKALVAVVDAKRNGRPETHRLRAEKR